MIWHKCKPDKSGLYAVIIDNDRRAYTMLRQTRSVRKALGMADQLSLFDQLDQEDQGEKKA